MLELSCREPLRVGVRKVAGAPKRGQKDDRTAPFSTVSCPPKQDAVLTERTGLEVAFTGIGARQGGGVPGCGRPSPGRASEEGL